MLYMFCDPVYILPMCEVKRRRLNLASTKPPDQRRVRARVGLYRYKVDEKATSVFMEHVKNNIEREGVAEGLMCPSVVSTLPPTDG